jgi:2-keto-4-pentenoate hydratase
MLMSSLADHYAYQLLEARAHSRIIAPISRSSDLSPADAYDIAYSLDIIRIAEGERIIGRKLGLSKSFLHQNKNTLNAHQSTIFTSLFSSTVRVLDEKITIQNLNGALQPKLEPLMVFKLARTPTPHATQNELADCLEWMAHGLEIVVNPYGEEPFEVTDAIAAFGMHGALLIGEPHILSNSTRHHLGRALADASISLSCDERLIGAGYGCNVMLNPLNALWHLHQLINSQTRFPSLHKGEVIASGSWTNAYAIRAGQTWTTAFSGIGLAGLSVSFV